MCECNGLRLGVNSTLIWIQHYFSQENTATGIDSRTIAINHPHLSIQFEWNVWLAIVFNEQNSSTSYSRFIAGPILAWFLHLLDCHCHRLWGLLSSVESREQYGLAWSITFGTRYAQQESTVERKHCSGMWSEFRFDEDAQTNLVWAIFQIFEFLYHLNTHQTDLPDEYRRIACQALVCTKNHEYFLRKSTWMKFIDLPKWFTTPSSAVYSSVFFILIKFNNFIPKRSTLTL